jgi:hypothetical protein
MTESADRKTKGLGEVTIAFRCPEVLASAAQAAASADLCKVSQIARAALLKEMKQRGLYKKPELVG